MNEQIKALAGKAGFWTTDKFCEGETAQYLEKFAELIVQECVEIARQAQRCYSDADYEIEKHFED